MREKFPENITWMFSGRYSWKTCYCYRYSCVGLTELKWNNDNLGKIIFRLWQAFDYIGLSEWQLSWTIFFRNLPWKVNFVMAKFLWIVRLSTYQSIFVLSMDFIFSLSIHQHAPLGIQTPHSFSICSLQPQIKKHQNILLTTIARAFPRNKPNASLKIDRRIHYSSFWNDTCKCLAKYFITFVKWQSL